MTLDADPSVPWLATRSGRGFVAAAVLAVLAADALTGSLVVAQFTMLAALIFAAVTSTRLARRGQLPLGIRRLMPIGFTVWSVGHVVETITVIRHPAPMPYGAFDIGAVGAAGLLLFGGLRLWTRSATYLDRTQLVRASLDGLIVVLSVVVLYWHVIVLEVADTDPFGVTLAMSFSAVAGLTAATQLGRLWRRRDRGSLLLGVGSSVLAVGILLWTAAKLGTDLRLWASPLMAGGVLLALAGMADPSHRELVVVQEFARRDRLASIGVILAAWLISMVQLLRHPIAGMTFALAGVSMVIVYLRLQAMGRSERQLVDRLEVLAFTDPLTGIGNRRSLTTTLGGAGGAWLITIDLDGFKEVNDQYGHNAGDDVLRAFVERVRVLLPESSHLARIGGDEFAAVIVGDRQVSADLGERIVQAGHDPHYPTVSVSVGIARHEPGADPVVTLRDCDIALREAKRTGKNRLAWLTPHLRESRLRELTIADGLRSHLGALWLAFQPVVALDRGDAPLAVEALARWTHPSLGEVTPTEFIPLCERNGLIVEFGSVVIDRALSQLAEWVRHGTPRQVCINVSWLQLRDEQCVAALAASLRAAPDLIRWLVLEVTESVFGDDPRVIETVRMLRDLGVLIAVDDFGTGASSLTRLRRLPADILKIDRSLLIGLGTDPTADAMLATIQRLGQDLGMTVIAEGIEDADTAARVAAAGVVFAQGYHFGRPVPARQLPTVPRMPTPAIARRRSPVGVGQTSNRILPM